MSIQTMLKKPEFPVGVPVMVKCRHWNQFESGFIFPSGKRMHMIFSPELDKFVIITKNMFRFHNEIFSAYTDGLEVRLLNGNKWTCWDKIFVPKLIGGSLGDS